MGKDKLRRFRENLTFDCFVQPEFDEVFHCDHPLKGRWRSDFFRNDNPIVLELGCGKGRFTAGMAAAEPDALLCAVEKVPDAMVVAMERVRDAGLTNVRFLDRDAALLPEFFAPGEVSRIYINFPDPWPKKKQFKRRLTAPGFQKLYFDLLPPGGEVWLKTDNVMLYEWSLEQFQNCGWTLKEVTRDLHEHGIQGVMTDYEAKFHEQGVKINRLVAVRGEVWPCE